MMSGAYLLLVRADGDARAPQAQALARCLRARGWIQAPRLAGPVEVWTRGVVPIPVSVRDGVLIVGQAFERRRPSRPPLPSAPAQDVADQLCRRLWGAYVACWRDEGSGDSWVFRDPSGARDLLTWRRNGVQVVASDLTGLPPELEPPGMTVDWDAVADFLRRPVSLAARVALRGVTAVAPGDAVRLRDGFCERIWRPASWALASAPDDPARHLVNSVSEALDAWTGAFPTLMAEVSGGFDSAVVTLAARRAPRGDRVTAALNYYGDRLEGDERAWARQVSEHAALPLATIPKTLAPLREADFAELATGARPTLNALDPERDRDTAARVEAAGASALLTGYGGDAVFYQMPSALPLVDYLRGRSVGALFDPFPAALAQWLRRSVWSLMCEARRQRVSVDRATYLDGFLGARALGAPGQAAHPWLEQLDALAPGKQLQLLHLATSQLAYGPSRRGAAAQLVHPLMSQPVLEACLAIPSWRLVEAGRDRALARRAFADLLPAEVATRRSKGTLTSFYTRKVAASLDFLRSYLLDGLLTTNGPLDRAAVEAALDVDQLIWRGHGMALLNAAAVEAWVRHWQ